MRSQKTTISALAATAVYVATMLSASADPSAPYAPAEAAPSSAPASPSPSPSARLCAQTLDANLHYDFPDTPHFFPPLRADGPTDEKTTAPNAPGCAITLRYMIPLSKNMRPKSPDPNSTVSIDFTKKGLQVMFAFRAQPPFKTEADIFSNDNILISIYRSGRRRPVLSVTVDPNGSCFLQSTSARQFRNNACKAKVTSSYKEPPLGWSGSVAIDYQTLDSVLSGDKTFALGVTRKQSSSKLYLDPVNSPFSYPQSEEGAQRLACIAPGPKMLHGNVIGVCERNLISCAAPNSPTESTVIDGKPDQYYNECGDVSERPSSLRLDRRPGLLQYVTVGADFGEPNGVPPHRIVTNIAFPIDSSNLVAASFADDAGKVLSIRDTSAKAILDQDVAKSFACTSCGSFQTTFVQPFVQSITSKNAVGVDLSLLGVDTPPFDFAAASFPIDAGYKFVHSADAMLGAALFDGSTTSTGVARDSVVQYQHAIYWGPPADPSPSPCPTILGGSVTSDNLNCLKDQAVSTSNLQYELYDVNANRSELPTLAPGPYPAIAAATHHSNDTQASVAYTHSLTRSLNGLPSAVTSSWNSYSALFRVGSQYVPGSQTIDFALSTLRDPSVLNFKTFHPERVHTGIAAGYRSVGDNYFPLDQVFDVHAGEHGEYGVVDISSPLCREPDQLNATEALRADATRLRCKLRTQQADLEVTGYRFSDFIEARDQALAANVTVPFFDTLSFQASYQIGTLAISQVARSNNLAVNDAQSGRDYLPNDQYTAQVKYSANTGDAKAFELAAGYSQAQAQGCNPKLFVAPPPCYGYRSPSFVGSLFWRPFHNGGDFFLQASMQNSTNQPFATSDQLVSAPAYRNFYETTASHIVRSAGLGTHLFTKAFANGCSSFLLTTINRGGDADNFAKSPPQPGFTNTASFELVPSTYWPTILTAYSRIGNSFAAEKNQSLFVIRVLYGILPRTYSSAVNASCGK